MNSQLDVLTGSITALMFVAGVAAMMNDFSHATYYSMNQIEPNKRLELEQKYGKWAVETAIAVCPLGDIKCIEREAKRLIESRISRKEV